MGVLFFLLPGNSYADTSHIVKPGDTLWKISQTYNVKTDIILELNNLHSDLIYPGQKLLIVKDNNTEIDTEIDTNAQSFTPLEDNNLVSQLLNYAKTFIGTPYRSSGSSPGGFDCSGYTSYVYKQFKIDLPRVSKDQYKFGKSVDASQAKPGDLVAFTSNGRINHVGIYIGNGEFIHSSSTQGVVISKINDPYWGPRFSGYSRVVASL